MEFIVSVHNCDSPCQNGTQGAEWFDRYEAVSSVNLIGSQFYWWRGCKSAEIVPLNFSPLSVVLVELWLRIDICHAFYAGIVKCYMLSRFKSGQKDEESYNQK